MSHFQCIYAHIHRQKFVYICQDVPFLKKLKQYFCSKTENLTPRFTNNTHATRNSQTTNNLSHNMAFLVNWLNQALDYFGITQYFSGKEAKLVFLGLDNSGKTTLFTLLKTGKVRHIIQFFIKHYILIFN